MRNVIPKGVLNDEMARLRHDAAFLIEQFNYDVAAEIGRVMEERGITKDEWHVRLRRKWPASRGKRGIERFGINTLVRSAAALNCRVSLRFIPFDEQG